ncbi:unnamed protein product [Peniophora sp. CBMAI 1063]|nr:unnamed protein product [Peniophora sp. CBMAI 1063]
MTLSADTLGDQESACENADYEDARTSTMSRMSGPVTILGLDDDVLREIFSWSTASVDQVWGVGATFENLAFNAILRARHMYLLARICRRFKDIVYGHAALWAAIVGVPGDDESLSFVLQKTSQAPLTLVRPFFDAVPDAQHDFAKHNMHRFAILRLKQTRDRNWAPVLSGRTLPTLTGLSVITHQDPFYRGPPLVVGQTFPVKTQPHYEDDIPPLYAPNLRFLELQAFYIPFRAPQLQDLQLTSIRGLSPPALMDALSALPLLRRLSIVPGRPSMGPQDDLPDEWRWAGSPIVSLPNIEYVHLEGVESTFVAGLFTSAVIPLSAGISVHIGVLAGMEDMDAIASALRRFISYPAYDSVRFQSGVVFDLFTQGADESAPRISLRMPIMSTARGYNFFECVAKVAQHLPRRHV